MKMSAVSSTSSMGATLNPSMQAWRAQIGSISATTTLAPWACMDLAQPLPTSPYPAMKQGNVADGGDRSRRPRVGEVLVLLRLRLAVQAVGRVLLAREDRHQQAHHELDQHRPRGQVHPVLYPALRCAAVRSHLQRSHARRHEKNAQHRGELNGRLRALNRILGGVEVDLA